MFERPGNVPEIEESCHISPPNLVVSILIKLIKIMYGSMDKLFSISNIKHQLTFSLRVIDDVIRKKFK